MNISNYTRSKPQLINDKTYTKIDSYLNNLETKEFVWGIDHFWIHYVMPNLLIIIILVMIISFLSIRYLLKQYRKKREKKRAKTNPKVKDEEDMLIDELNLDLDNNLEDDEFNDVRRPAYRPQTFLDLTPDTNREKFDKLASILLG